MNYLGQMLLGGKAPVPENIFQLYESISHLFAEALIANQTEDFKTMSDASGLVYNVGFVYNTLQRRGEIKSSKSGYSKMPDTVAYGIMESTKPEALLDRIHKADLEAYYLSTMGFPGESARAALYGARLCQEHAYVRIFEGETNENSVCAGDFVPWFLACGVHAAVVAPPPVQGKLFQDITEYGGWCADELGLVLEDDIIKCLTVNVSDAQDIVRLEAWNPTKGHADFDLVAHPPGVGDAFVLAMRLVKRLGVTTNIWIGRTEEGFNKLWDQQWNRLIIVGGAESRDGLGEFISSLDPSISNFFQFISKGPLGVPVETISNDRAVTVFTTWTVGDSVRALARYLDQVTEGRMDTSSFVTAILESPIVRSFGDTMGTSFVRLSADACARSIGQRVRKYGATFQAKSRDALRKRLETLLSTKGSGDAAKESKAHEVAQEIVRESDPILIRAAGDVLVSDHGTEAFGAVLQSMRNPTISAVEISDFCTFLTNFVAYEIETVDDDESLDRIEQLGEFQRVFREYSHRVDRLRQRQKARGKREGEELSDLSTDLFNSAAALKRFLSSEGRS
jgi:hypothetical protein